MNKLQQWRAAFAEFDAKGIVGEVGAVDSHLSQGVAQMHGQARFRVWSGLARLGIGAAWHLRCANRTPRWTTRWSELANVKAR
ncbi:DUF4113 domain-containing protein [Halomonas sp. TRM85114]|nr:DUF4113 domain-containing protein [Halomonas jincaotanensis]